MKRRARQVAIGVVVLGVAVLATLAVLHWGAVRDHLEAWRFQRARKMETISPRFLRNSGADDGDVISLAELSELLELFKADGSSEFHASPLELFGLLADCSGLPVIFDSGLRESPSHCRVSTTDAETLGVAEALRILNENGFRTLEQFIPRRAHVVVERELSGEERDLAGY